MMRMREQLGEPVVFGGMLLFSLEGDYVKKVAVHLCVASEHLSRSGGIARSSQVDYSAKLDSHLVYTF